eukprot:618344-Prymnesium_polylepis.1
MPRLRIMRRWERTRAIVAPSVPSGYQTFGGGRKSGGVASLTVAILNVTEITMRSQLRLQPSASSGGRMVIATSPSLVSTVARYTFFELAALSCRWSTRRWSIVCASMAAYVSIVRELSQSSGSVQLYLLPSRNSRPRRRLFTTDQHGALYSKEHATLANRPRPRAPPASAGMTQKDARKCSPGDGGAPGTARDVGRSRVRR